MEKRLPDRVLIVGGNSRAARAYREHCAQVGGTNPIMVLTRGPNAPLPGENVRVVSDYFSPPPSIFHGIDTVINFTGVVSGPDMKRVNANGPAALARLARDAGVRQFVHVSSLSVYGPAESIDRSTPETPTTPYGRSKLAGDHALADFATSTFKVALLRVPTLYGPGMGKITKLTNMLAKLRWFPAPHILQPRSILHLENLALAIKQVVSHNHDGVLFAADPQPFQLDFLAAAIEAVTGKSMRLIELPDFAFDLLAGVAPEGFASLYTRSVINSHLCIPLPASRYMNLEATVADILSSTIGPGNPA